MPKTAKPLTDAAVALLYRIANTAGHMNTNGLSSAEYDALTMLRRQKLASVYSAGGFYQYAHLTQSGVSFVREN